MNNNFDINQYDQIIERLKFTIDTHKQLMIEQNALNKKRDDLVILESKLKIKFNKNNEEKKNLLKQLIGKNFEEEVFINIYFFIYFIANFIFIYLYRILSSSIIANHSNIKWASKMKIKFIS